MPAVRLGEDRLFFEALRRVDARVRHAPEACVVVSARIVGRAQGGMADTIRRRMTCMDTFLDDRLEPVRDAARRALLRARARAEWQQRSGVVPESLAAGLALPPSDIAPLLRERWFGTAWEHLEAASPKLRRRSRVAVTELEREASRADVLLRRLRLGAPADAEGPPSFLAAAPGGGEMPLPVAAAPA